MDSNKQQTAAGQIPDYDDLFVHTKGKKNPFFRKLVKLNLFSLILSTLVFFLQNAPIWIVPICTSNIINLVTKAVQNGANSDIWRSLTINAVVMGITILQNVPSTIWRWKISSNMLRRTSAGIKSSVVRKLQVLSITYHKDMQTGKIQSKFLKDTDTADGLFHLLVFSLIPNVITVTVSIGISLYRNVWVSLFFLLVIPFNVGLTYFFRKTIRQRHRDFRLKTEAMSMRLTTMLQMLPVTKAHGLEEKELENIQSSIYNLSNSGRKMDGTFGKFGAASWVINALLSAVCLAFCSILAIKRVISVGDIVLYQAMFSSISGGISALIGVLPNISGGFEALSSISEVMESDDVERTLGKKPIPSIEGNVTFDHLYYRYPNTENYVLSDFSLQVRAGECIAVVGASGSGKSTLMNLLIGLLLPTKGDMRIDGESVCDVNLPQYRRHLSVVSQNTILFPGTIRENITYGLDSYSEEELKNVVAMANLEEFVKDLPSGLDTQVGEYGDKLSGGQKQRITIARALLRNPKILILDEATSALDNISEYHVQQAISKSIQGRTTFIVAHRLSTIRNADRIVVLEGGKMVEIGTYEELMEKQGKFYELKQLNDLTWKAAEGALQ